MKKVLIISYFYPPLGGPGALRILNFTKYLPKYGWESYVISVKNPDRYFNIMGKEKVPEDIKVYYTKNILPLGWAQLGMEKYFGIKNFYSIPDIYIGWLIPTVLKAKKIIEKENIDLIFTSSLPWTSSLIGVLLKKLTRKPLVIEFRDAWSFNPYIRYPTKSHAWLNLNLENICLRVCDYFITVMEYILNKYKQKYDNLEKKSAVIYNGFTSFNLESNKFEKFTVVHIGSFYGSRSPEEFLEALESCISKMLPKTEIQFLVIGKQKKRFVDILEKYEIVRILDTVSNEEVGKFIFNSHLLLLIEKTNSLTTKIFEYLASGNPILALIPEGEAAQMIRKYSDNSYIITDYDNTQKIAEAIYDCYTKWKEGKLNKKISKKTIEFRKKFNREAETKQLAEIFDKVMEG